LSLVTSLIGLYNKVCQLFMKEVVATQV